MSWSDTAFGSEAVWIGSEHPFDLHEAYLCFRSPAGFELDSQPEKAELYITADSRYKLWVNGRYVARGPARSYPQQQQVDCLDIGDLLKPGRNTLAVQVYQPGYSHFAYVHRAAAGLLCSLHCDGERVLVSDNTWRVHRDHSFAANAPRVSIYGSGVEVRDMNQFESWTSVGYSDDGWAQARIVAGIGAAPWTALRQRDLPLLVEHDTPATLLEMRKGKRTDQDDPHLSILAGWPSAAIQPLPQDKDGWLEADLGPGETAFWLYDLGRDYLCQGVAAVDGAGGQEMFDISYAEKFRNGELVISDPETYCRVRITDRFHLRPGQQQLETFTLRGGRYILVQVTGPTGLDFKFRPSVRASEYPLETTESLVVADEVLQAIVELCETTFHACLQDGFVDCTWRESSQWLGDALPQALIMSSMSDDVRPLRQAIEMAVQGVYPDGVLPSVSPGEVHAYTIVDYNFMWVQLLQLYWQLTGDADFVQAMWPALVKMLDRFHEDIDEQGLISNQPGRRLFLDWAPVSRSEPNAIYNLQYLLGLQIASDMADEHNEPLLAELWRARAETLGVNIRQAFWEDGRWWDDLERTTYSQLSAALALLTCVTLPQEKDAQLDAIIARSLDPSDDYQAGHMVLTSPFMHHYLFQALRMAGRDDAVIEIIKTRWGRWTRAGYPTTWENWNVDFPDGSQCHSFSAHPRYFLAEIARAKGGTL